MFIDCHNHIGIELGQYLAGGFPYGQHLNDLVHNGRTHGIGRWIVFPMVTNLALNIAAMRDGRIVTEGALESVPYAWENRRMMHEIHTLFPVEGRAALPFAMFDPMRDTQAQAQELRKLQNDHRIYGLKTQPTIIQSPIISLNKEGRIFLELAQEWDLPMLIHSSVRPTDIWSQASDIIDIAEQWPQVRFCVAHSCRFDRICLDRIAALPNCWFDCSAHGIHCVLALQDNLTIAPRDRRFQSDYSRPDRVLKDLALAYGDKLMWGSDAPYYSFAAEVDAERMALLSSYEAETQYFHALPVVDKQRAGWVNTLAFLGQKLPDLQPQ